MENQGNNPTWRNYRSSSSIDLTLTTPGARETISEWRADFETTSDHALVSFKIRLQENDEKRKITTKYTNWARYREILGGEEWVPPVEWHAGEVEKQAKRRKPS